MEISIKSNKKEFVQMLAGEKIHTEVYMSLDDEEPVRVTNKDLKKLLNQTKGVNDEGN